MRHEATGTNETSDVYHAVVAILNGRWRVIDSCQYHPHRQWILQYRSSQKRADSWTTKPPFGSFCQIRQVLLREVKRKVTQGRKPLELDPVAWRILEDLPEKDLGYQPPFAREAVYDDA